MFTAVLPREFFKAIICSSVNMYRTIILLPWSFPNICRALPSLVKVIPDSESDCGCLVIVIPEGRFHSLQVTAGEVDCFLLTPTPKSGKMLWAELTVDLGRPNCGGSEGMILVRGTAKGILGG